MTDRDRAELVVDLHDHLVATRERPVEQTAQRWIGEAEAVAGDLVNRDVEPSVLDKRIRQVQSLLAEVEDTEDPTTTAHIEAARELATDILSE